MELVRIKQTSLATLLEQVLRQQGFAVHCRQDGEEQVIVLEDPAQYAAAKAVLEDFLRHPQDARWQEKAWQNNQPASGLPQQPLFTGRWWSSLGPVTRAGLIVCVLVFLSPFLFGTTLYQALLFPETLQGLTAQPWRLFTPMFLHFSVLHILFNLLWWSDLGRLIERFQSSTQLLLITLLTAGISNVAQFLDTGNRFGGMSGVVYGLLGYLWIYGKVNPAAGYQLRREIVILMLAWLVICYVGLSGVVANSAHLAGLVSGCALGAITGWWRRTRVYGG